MCALTILLYKNRYLKSMAHVSVLSWGNLYRQITYKMSEGNYAFLVQLDLDFNMQLYVPKSVDN